MYDDTMNKAAYIHELIRGMCNRPDLPEGSLHFEARTRKRGKVEIAPIKITHNYPTRIGDIGVWRHGTAFELPFNVRNGTKYVTHAEAVFDETVITIRARCGPNDDPRRWMGRTIALMRMARILAPLGYDVLAVWGKGKDAPHMVIPGDVQIPKDWMPQEVVERLWRQQRRLEGVVGTERGKKRGKPKNTTWVRGYGVPTAATVDTGWKPTAASCNVSGCTCCDEGGRVGG